MPTQIEIRGAHETRQALRNVAEGLVGQPMVGALRQATLLVERDAKREAPVDSGRLRASITSDVVATPGLFAPGVRGIVGSNVSYAPSMEFGTGTFAGKSPHFPPYRALEVWARRHNLNAYVVAQAIGRRGGLKGVHYFQKALDKNEERIVTLLGSTVRNIISRS